MSRVLVIGCGGVASVAIRKCCQVSDVFTELCIASRTKSKCDQLAADLAGKTATKITTAQVDADKVDEVIALIKGYQPDLVMNIALPYQDLTIMDACLACGVNYMDTANYEPEDIEEPEWKAVYEKRCKEKGFSAYFDYTWQWAYREKFEKAGLIALLGCGFDPGVTQAYCAYAKKHEFDTIDTIDILDCNGGDHGYPFATNFNPEVNLREVSAPGSYWENGHWGEIPERPLGGDPRHEHQAGISLRPGGGEGHVPAPPRGDRIPGGEHPRGQAHPLLHDLRPELSHPHEVSGERGDALHHPCGV
ncbi:saccharopine dehydrogenase [Oscillibacter sp. CAG:155]|nr:saccharopine dehydrogenase [Oscillibacter sp. CAG:155]